MVRVRFAPSPTGSLHLGSALSAVANRSFADEHGGVFLLRIDDTDAARNVEGGAEAIVEDLAWLGVGWDEGPVRQSERFVRHREAAHLIGEPDAEGALRFGRTTLLRADGSPTYQLASAVDDLDFGITHVIRGSDHRANAELQTELIRALGGEPPEFVHHGLLLGEDGTKLSKRHGASSLADLRDAGIPPEAVRAYLEELGLPKHDVQLDLPRLRRLSTEALAALSDEELAERVGVPVSVAPVLRGARDLAEARALRGRGARAGTGDAAAGSEADARPVPGAGRERRRSEGDRARAEGGRRRSEGGATRAHRTRARTGARRGDRGAAAGRAAAPHSRLGRCVSTAR